MKRRPATRPGIAVLSWARRELTPGLPVLAVATAGYLALEVVTYAKSYPDGFDADQFAVFADNPATRMLQGVPTGTESAAGYAVWDGGWVLEIVVGLWAVLAVSRLLRGEDDSGRAELLLLGPLSARETSTLTLVAMVAGAVLTGGAASAGLLLSGADPTGSIVFGLGLAGFAALFVGLGAMASQVFGVRRRAVGVAAACLGATFILRMVANSTDARAWIGWLTPFGWMDRLQAFGDLEPRAMVPLVLGPVVLLSAAVWLRGRRDTGGALLRLTETRAPRLSGLESPGRFAWRSETWTLVGWMLGLGAYGFVLGSLIPAMIDFLDEDETYRELIRQLGVDVSAQGLLGVMSITLSVAFALYAAWRMAASRQEESSGRVENLFSRPVGRTTWLLTNVMLTLLGAALLTSVTGLAVWAGSLTAGADTVSLRECLVTMTNSWSVVVLVTGVAVLTFGLAPRWTLAVPVAVTVGGYVLALLGPPLGWPSWAVDLSPLAHLAYVPAEPMALGEAAAMALVGAGAAAVGIARFQRRDLQPA